MRKDLTDLTVVLDRSGSMHEHCADTEGGLNTFIEGQKKLPGQCLFSLVQFDTEYEFVHRGVPVQDVPKCVLVPRGNTALLDAVGKAINEAGERLAKMPEAARPGLVVFVIVTDGQENASTEFTRKQVKELIEHQRDAYKWQFTFLGANQDAFAEAGALGIPTSGAASVMPKCYPYAYSSALGNVGRMRAATAGGQSVVNEYTKEERTSMVEEKKDMA